MKWMLLAKALKRAETIKWTFRRTLGEDHTHSILTRFRQNINSAFYIRYHYAYILVNNELRVRMVYYDKQRGSSWINNFAEAEQESNRLNIRLITSSALTQNGCL